VEEYRDNVVVSDDMSRMVDGGDADGVENWELYCENGHTEAGMKCHLATKENPDESATR